jgi:hypothetical protein
MNKRKSSRGRRAGQLGKAHQSVHQDIAAMWQNLDAAAQEKALSQGITPEVLEEWQHGGLATVGNFPNEVQWAAFNLGKLVREYKRVLAEKRWNLEANRRGVQIPLPLLPAGEQFNEHELRLLRESGHDVIWVMQHYGFIEAFRLLSYMIRAAAENDSGFFKEFWRRVQSGVPLESPAEPVYSALTSLKRCFNQEKWDDFSGTFYQKEIPSIVPVLKLPPGQRPPLTLAQIADYVRVFGGRTVSDRALSRHAKAIGIPIARRGRRKRGS